MHPRLLGVSALFLVTLACLAAPTPAGATQVWSGYAHAFSKPAGADWTQTVNQDFIVPDCVITRQSTHGIYNIALEPSYSSISPQNTEWATGLAVNHAALTFQSWVNWNAGCPPCLVGVNACMHIISDDIYVDIRFDTWAETPSGGGAFSYHRGEPQVVPTQSTSWGTLKLFYR